MDALARYTQRKRNKVLINTSTTLELLSKVDGIDPLLVLVGMGRFFTYVRFFWDRHLDGV